MSDDITDRVRIERRDILADDWGTLTKVHFAWRRRDGTWQAMDREVYDRGDVAVILLYDRERREVVLTRQFRLPAHLNGGPGLQIEAAAGLLDGDDPEVRIRAEVAEETGYGIRAARHLFTLFPSPGAATEKMHFYAAEIAPGDRIGAGGGLASEGEDIEVLELPFDAAMAMIADGRINDMKTVVLLQWAAANVFS